MKYQWLRKTGVQIFLASVFMMAFVLALSLLFTYSYGANLLENKEELYITSLAEQMNQRIHSVIQEVDSDSLEVALNPTIQELLIRNAIGSTLSLEDKIAIRGVFLDKIRFSNTITSMDLYYEYSLLYPIGDRSTPLLSEKWKSIADEKRGKLAWIGNNPNDESELLAIRQVRVIDQGYEPYGYLLISVSKKFVEIAEEGIPTVDGMKIYLFSESTELLVTNTEVPFTLYDSVDNRVILEEKEYVMVQRKSRDTQWAVVILSPVEKILSGLSSLKTLYLIVFAIGIVILFLFSVLLSNIITKPMRKMISSLNHTHDGVLTTNSDTYYNYEIDQLNREYNAIIHKNNILVKEVYHKELAARHAEIKAIQAQINPHFLFNTLEALYWTLQDQGNDDLGEQVLALSQMFRYTIQSSSSSVWVELHEEIQHIQRYLEIMKFRIGDRLSWNISIPDDLQHIMLPKLLIQPIVENSIKYGIEKKEGIGIITITGKNIDRDFYSISVSDNGIGMDISKLDLLQNSMVDQQSQSNHGIGLLNVCRRIQLNFSIQYPLNIISKVGEGTTVTIMIRREAVSYDL